MEKMIRVAYSNVRHLSTSSQISQTVASQTRKQDYYKQIHENERTNSAKPLGWDEAKHFEEMPGLKPLPLIGNAWRFIFGELKGMDFVELHKILEKRYGDICSIKKLAPGEDFVFIFNSNDIQTLFRNDGIWPIRDPFPSLAYHRNVLRKDIYRGVAGLGNEHGEKWAEIRTIANPFLMQPRVVMQYVDSMNEIAEEFVGIMRKFAKDDPKSEMPEDFGTELGKWALESIGFVALDRRLGCLDSNPTLETQLLVKNSIEMFDLMYELDIKNPVLWRYFSTPTYKRFVACTDYVTNITLKYVEETFHKIKNQGVESPDGVKSVLMKLLEVDKQIAFVMAMDMLNAGIDTVSKSTSALLYYLAKNPRVQMELRKELRKLLPEKNSPITKEVLTSSSYLKATIKESLRLAPAGAGNLRRTQKDMVIRGYRIPKGVKIITDNIVISRRDFPRGEEFLPERWLRTTGNYLSHKKVNPFTSLPFGFGPRSCIGMRLANLEMEVLVAKIFRNFSLEWHYPDMRFKQSVIYGPVDPLRFTVRELSE